MREDPEEFYRWAAMALDRERRGWYSDAEFKSPYAYGQTRTPR